MEETEISEEIEIDVQEAKISKEQMVKDLVFNVNTMSSGAMSFVTEHINGILEGVFIDSQDAVQLNISIADTNITIFQIMNIQGNQFIPLRLGVVDGTGMDFRGIADKWALNNSLRFDIRGPLNSEVQFIVRYI